MFGGPRVVGGVVNNGNVTSCYALTGKRRNARGVDPHGPLKVVVPVRPLYRGTVSDFDGENVR